MSEDLRSAVDAAFKGARAVADAAADLLVEHFVRSLPPDVEKVVGLSFEDYEEGEYGPWADQIVYTDGTVREIVSRDSLEPLCDLWYGGDTSDWWTSRNPSSAWIFRDVIGDAIDRAVQSGRYLRLAPPEEAHSGPRSDGAQHT